MIVYKKTVVKLTRRQAAVMKILRCGGTQRATVNLKNKMKYRLMDATINPLRYVDPRTLKALQAKELITKKQNHYVCNLPKQSK
jgi:hypothetical protein